MENDEWIRIAVSYSTDAFVAAKKLATVPALLRPIMHWFLPECQKIRHQIRRCRELIAPEVERRLRDIENNGGKPRKRVLDSVDWFSAACRGQSLDYPCAELELNLASIHTQRIRSALPSPISWTIPSTSSLCEKSLSTSTMTLESGTRRPLQTSVSWTASSKRVSVITRCESVGRLCTSTRKPC